jgi:pimeloyl-ACP methyl ester carboxylesterase
VGIWQGTIETANLKVVFNITENTDHTLAATMDSLDQNVFGIPARQVTCVKGHFRLAVPIVQGSYEGQMNDDGSEIDGKWTQGKPLTLNLKKTSGIPAQATPNPKFQAAEDKMKASAEMEPKKPYPYLDEGISFINSQAGVTLSGILTLPKGRGPFPAAILISGSGPNDRDETVFGHHIFLVISDYLTRHGIATLRYDKRGVGASSGDYGKATTEDFAADSLAGVAYLKGRKEINPKNIGLIGHSEGGLIAPMAAVKSTDVSFIVLLAGPGIDGEKILNRQSGLAMKAKGMDEKLLVQNQMAQKDIFHVLRLDEDHATTLKKIREIGERTAHQMADGDKEKEEKILTGIRSQEEITLSPWLRFFIDYDPKIALEKVRCPVLVMNGEKDSQVDSKENLTPIEEALKKGGNPDYTVKEWEGVNHLFQDCKTGGLSEYSDAVPTPKSEVLEFLTEWVLKRVK